jgi:hypothetical protein
MAKQSYYVHCGNWCVKVLIDSKDFNDTSLRYIEAATRSFEYIFGNKDFSDTDTLIAIYDKNNKNVVNTIDELDAYTEATFTTYTEVYSNLKNPILKSKILSSNLFANAAQFDNYTLAKQIEQTEGL